MPSLIVSLLFNFFFIFIKTEKINFIWWKFGLWVTKLTVVQVVAISPHILDLCLFMRQNFKRQKGTVKCDGSPYLSQWVKNGKKYNKKIILWPWMYCIYLPNSVLPNYSCKYLQAPLDLGVTPWFFFLLQKMLIPGLQCKQCNFPQGEFFSNLSPSCTEYCPLSLFCYIFGFLKPLLAFKVY